jgi:hypothetical protein
MTYTVIWQIEVDADTPFEAAQLALAIQRDPTSTATVFIVEDSEGRQCGEYDLGEAS